VVIVMIVVTTAIMAVCVGSVRLVVVLRLAVLVACGVSGRRVHDDQPDVRVA